jgi:hypothetical protein
LPLHAKAEDLTILYSLYRTAGPARVREVTPRDIKTFVNSIGALHRQWGDEIPLVLQGAYVLCSDRIRSERDLLSEDLIGPQALPFVEGVASDWRLYVAAVHFNVSVEEAPQLILGRTIERSLASGAYEELQDLTTVPGFLVVCERVTQDRVADWQSSQPSGIALAGRALAGVGIGGDGEGSRIWMSLIRAVKRVDQMELLDERVGEGVVALLERDELDSRSLLGSHVVGVLSRGVSRTPEAGEAESDEQVSKWTECAVPVVRHLLREQPELLEDLRVPGETAFYLGVLRALRRRHESTNIVAKFLPTVPREAVMAELVRLVEQGQTVPASSELVETLMQVSGEWEISAYAASLVQRLRAETGIGSSEASGCLRCLLALDRNDEAVLNGLGQLARGGHLFHLFSVARRDSDPQLSALSLGLILSLVPDGTAEELPGNAGAGTQDYFEVVDAPDNFSEILDILGEHIPLWVRESELLDAGNTVDRTRGLVRAAISRSLKTEAEASPLTPEEYLRLFSSIQSWLGQDLLRPLTSLMISRGGLLEKLQSDEFDSERHALYLLALELSRGG